MMAPELLLLTRRSNLKTSLPILTLLVHVFICTYCFAQPTQMNGQWYMNDDILKEDFGEGIKLCLKIKLEYHQGQFIQGPKIEQQLFEKANRMIAPAYSPPHQQTPEDTISDCKDFLSTIHASFELGYNLSTSPSFLHGFPPNMTEMP